MRQAFTLKLAGLICLGFVAQTSWGLGFERSETKEQLKLRYDVEVKDHGNGTITAVLTLADEGRMKPLTGVGLTIPSGVNKDGSGPPDLSVELAGRDGGGGKKVYVFQMREELAARAEFHLKTRTLDGKEAPLTWYYHAVRVGKIMKARQTLD